MALKRQKADAKNNYEQDPGLRTQAEPIQHEYIQYCYSSGIHKYVNIG